MCFRLGVQPRLHQWRHGEGTPAASKWRHSHPDVWTSAYDPVRLQPQSGQSWPLQQPQVHLLDVCPHQRKAVWASSYYILYLESIKALVQLQWVLHYVCILYLCHHIHHATESQHGPIKVISHGRKMVNVWDWRCEDFFVSVGLEMRMWFQISCKLFLRVEVHYYCLFSECLNTCKAFLCTVWVTATCFIYIEYYSIIVVVTLKMSIFC